MNHDITHCSGEDVRGILSEQIERIECQKRRSCVRYKAYLDLENYNGMVSMMLPFECIENDYAMYIEKK